MDLRHGNHAGGVTVGRSVALDEPAVPLPGMSGTKF